MNVDRISDRLAAKIAMENSLGADPLTQKVAEFFRDNPAPSDSDFHSWCEEQELDPHVAEAAAYRLATMASDFLFYGRADENDVSDEDVTNYLNQLIEDDMLDYRFKDNQDPTST